jgi:3-oxoacyl-[acyl-carrier protein] reductase
MGELDGMVVLVTGCGRGFGRGVALAMGNSGARVAAVALEGNELDSLARTMRGRGQEVLAMPTDLSSAAEIERMRDGVLGAYGHVDVVFNNAAVSLWKRMEETTVEDWDLTLNVNLRAYFLVAKAFLSSMKRRRGGSIVNVTSTSSERGFVAEIAYCPSKYGIEGLTQCMALELMLHNIAVNSLNVAAIEGKQLKPTGLTTEEEQKLPQSVRGGYADYDELAKAYGEAWTFLALQRGDGVTGQRFRTKELAELVRTEGSAATTARFSGKLTKAVYQPMEFPKSERYQVPGGGTAEIVYE